MMMHGLANHKRNKQIRKRSEHVNKLHYISHYTYEILLKFALWESLWQMRTDMIKLTVSSLVRMQLKIIK